MPKATQSSDSSNISGTVDPLSEKHQHELRKRTRIEGVGEGVENKERMGKSG
jgi:hypothetical protein